MYSIKARCLVPSGICVVVPGTDDNPPTVVTFPGIRGERDIMRAARGNLYLIVCVNRPFVTLMGGHKQGRESVRDLRTAEIGGRIWIQQPRMPPQVLILKAVQGAI